ncbi:MAG: hypothetical protein MUF54_10025 [Polyangiaceae bacterium]|nr:hypothetical protein [Polyangiaceae bacterium]
MTASVGGRKLAVEDVADKRIAGPLAQMGRQVAATLERIRCPVHGKQATNVRLHFDPRGKADLQYDSCCEELGKQVRAALG